MVIHSSFKVKFINGIFIWFDVCNYLDNKKNIYNYQYNNLTQDDIVTLVHDFYKTRSKSIFLKFLECYDKRKTNLQFVKAGSLDNNPGLSFLINTIKESYILCEYTGTIYDVTKLAHEYGHATMFLYDKNMYEDKNIVYTELDGIYFELEMMKYLYKNNILKEDVSLAALVEHNYMHDASAYLSYNLDLNGLVYLLSHMISIEICTRNDKDELFEKIVTYKPKSIMDSINFIEKYITLNEHLQEYHSKVIKRANKYVLSKK